MTEKEIYNKAKKTYREDREIIKFRLDDELIDAIDNLVVLSVSINLSLEELLSGNYDKLFEKTVEILFKDCGNTCESGLDCWNVLRQIEKKYITAAYNFVVAGRNI